MDTILWKSGAPSSGMKEISSLILPEKNKTDPFAATLKGRQMENEKWKKEVRKLHICTMRTSLKVVFITLILL